MTKLNQLGLRVPDDLLAKLQDVCDRRGSTMNAILNERLRESFSNESSELFDNKQLFGILQVLAAAMSTAGQLAAVNDTLQPSEAARWLQSPVAYEQALRAAVRVLEKFRPEDPYGRENPGAELDSGVQSLGVRSALVILREAATGVGQTATTDDRAHRLHDALSPEMTKRVGGDSGVRAIVTNLKVELLETPKKDAKKPRRKRLSVRSTNKPDLGK